MGLQFCPQNGQENLLNHQRSALHYKILLTLMLVLSKSLEAPDLASAGASLNKAHRWQKFSLNLLTTFFSRQPQSDNLFW